MFAVIETGGKQYKVEKGTIIEVEKLEGESGAKLSFDNVLLIGGEKNEVGAPLVDGAKVEGEVLDQFRDDKVIVFKKKRRQNYRRKAGHRQDLTAVRITEIKAK